MKQLILDDLIECAKSYCKENSGKYVADLYGITDGKAVGTYVEHGFEKYLRKSYDLHVGNSASGLDLPSINTDIKVTSIKQPQSSCPFKDSKQKIFGLGYNLIVFVYDKSDNNKNKKSKLDFVSCTLIKQDRTGDYQMTKGIHDILENNGNKDDIFAFLEDHNLPADEVTLSNIAEQIMKNPPKIGYLTISNALQWRLQYGRIVKLSEEVEGIVPIIKYTDVNDNK